VRRLTRITSLTTRSIIENNNSKTLGKIKPKKNQTLTKMVEQVSGMHTNLQTSRPLIG
jgi:hypothetical protein